MIKNVSHQSHLTPYDKVIATLDTYDPDRETIAIGTAAWVLHGLESPFIVPDVDALARQKFLQSLKHEIMDGCLTDGHRRVESSSKEYCFNANFRISAEPKPVNAESTELLPFQAYTGIEDDTYSITYEMAEQLAVPVGNTGRLALAPGVILDWKAKVGRPKDRKFVDAVVASLLGPR